ATLFSLLRVVAAPDNQAIALLLAAGPQTQGGLAPGRLRARMADGRLALATTVRVVHRVLRRAAHLRPAAEPAVAARLAQLHQGVFDVAHLADGRHAVGWYPPHLTRGQPQQAVLLFLGHQLGR